MLCLNTVHPIKTAVFCHSLEIAETLHSSSSEIKICVRKRGRKGGKFKSLFTDDRAFIELLTNVTWLLIQWVWEPDQLDCILIIQTTDSLKSSNSEIV